MKIYKVSKTSHISLLVWRWHIGLTRQTVPENEKPWSECKVGVGQSKMCYGSIVLNGEKWHPGKIGWL